MPILATTHLSIFHLESEYFVYLQVLGLMERNIFNIGGKVVSLRKGVFGSE